MKANQVMVLYNWKVGLFNPLSAFENLKTRLFYAELKIIQKNQVSLFINKLLLKYKKEVKNITMKTSK